MKTPKKSMEIIIENQYENHYLDYPFIKECSDKIIQLKENGGGNLIVELPPRTSKTTFFANAVPAWFSGNYPKENILIGSNLKESIQKFKSCIHTGRYDLCKVFSIIDRRYDLMIFDDPMKMNESKNSEVNKWFLESLLTRRQENCVTIIVMSRVLKNDIAGILRKEKDWNILSYPMLSEKFANIKINPMLRKHPNANINHADHLKHTLGINLFDAMYQQSPKK